MLSVKNMCLLRCIFNTSIEELRQSNAESCHITLLCTLNQDETCSPSKWQSREQCAFVSSALFKQCFFCQDHEVSQTNTYHSSVLMKTECYTFIKQRTLTSLPFFSTQMKHRNTLLLFSRKNVYSSK